MELTPLCVTKKPLIYPNYKYEFYNAYLGLVKC